MTFVALKLILANAFGWVVANWRMVAILAAIGVIAIASIFFVRGCSQRKAQLNEKELQQVHEAIETKERKKMEEVFVAVEVKEKEIDANVAYSNTQVVNAIAEAKKKASEMSNDELAAYLESLK
jgi:predicted tellurium resistance membrane protein TerC